MTGESMPGPLISVVIATRNRAELLRESLHSVISQTYKNIEIIVVDDGSDDNTRDVVESLDDDRIHYVRREHGGISAARNTGTECARGEWIAVHDDDDIMLPFRLAEQVEFISESVDFIYGTFINFDDETGSLQLHHGRNYGYGPALMSGFAPGHSTWLVRTSVMRLFRYDEGIESAVDNNLTFRMLRSGVRFLHSGVYCLMRRVHSGRITDTGGAGQKYVAGLNHAFISRGISKSRRDALLKAARRDWGPVDKTQWETRFLAYLPDHLVRRTGVVQRVTSVDNDRNIPAAKVSFVNATDMTWWDIFTAASRGADLSAVHVRYRESAEIERLLDAQETSGDTLESATDDVASQVLVDLASEDATSRVFAVAAARREVGWNAEQESLLAAQCEVGGASGDLLFGLIPSKTWEASRLIRDSQFPGDEWVYRIFTPNDLRSELRALGE